MTAIAKPMKERQLKMSLERTRKFDSSDQPDDTQGETNEHKILLFSYSKAFDMPCL